MRFANRLSHTFADLLKEEAGASLIEYALVGSLIMVVCMLLLLAWHKQN
ncbi:Flp family type IVb pilin [Variovorax sp. RT4R15]